MIKIDNTEKESFKRLLSGYVDKYYSNSENVNTEVMNGTVTITAKDTKAAESFIVKCLGGK